MPRKTPRPMGPDAFDAGFRAASLDVIKALPPDMAQAYMVQFGQLSRRTAPGSPVAVNNWPVNIYLMELEDAMQAAHPERRTGYDFCVRFYADHGKGPTGVTRTGAPPDAELGGFGNQCLHCRKAKGVSKCGGCMAVQYCSSACQKADWPAHKANCKEWTKRRTDAADAGVETNTLSDIGGFEGVADELRKDKAAGRMDPAVLASRETALGLQCMLHSIVFDLLKLNGVWANRFGPGVLIVETHTMKAFGEVASKKLSTQECVPHILASFLPVEQLLDYGDGRQLAPKIDIWKKDPACKGWGATKCAPRRLHRWLVTDVKLQFALSQFVADRGSAAWTNENYVPIVVVEHPPPAQQYRPLQEAGWFDIPDSEVFAQSSARLCAVAGRWSAEELGAVLSKPGELREEAWSMLAHSDAVSFHGASEAAFKVGFDYHTPRSVDCRVPAPSRPAMLPVPRALEAMLGRLRESIGAAAGMG